MMEIKTQFGDFLCGFVWSSCGKKVQIGFVVNCWCRLVKTFH